MSPRQKDGIGRAVGTRMHGENLSPSGRWGNPCRRDPQHHAPADKKGALATTAVPSVARAPKGACLMARAEPCRAQEPDKGNAGEEREKPRQPQGDDKAKNDARCASTAYGVIQSGHAIQTRPQKR